MSQKTLKFKKVDRGWESTDGRYLVWVQGRPHDDLPEWGAARLDDEGNYVRPWLCKFAGSRREAIETCIEDALARGEVDVPKPKTDVSKLPVWAQHHIQMLEANLRSAEKKLRAMAPDGPQDSEVGYAVLTDRGMEFRPLPPGTDIIFRLDVKKGREVHCRVFNDRAASASRRSRVCLNGRDTYGVGSLAVRPTSSNTLEVFLDPADQNENQR